MHFASGRHLIHTQQFYSIKTPVLCKQLNFTLSTTRAQFVGSSFSEQTCLPLEISCQECHHPPPNVFPHQTCENIFPISTNALAKSHTNAIVCMCVRYGRGKSVVSSDPKFLAVRKTPRGVKRANRTLTHRCSAASPATPPSCG